MSTTYTPEVNDATTTSWVPLTTTFTPGPSCSSWFLEYGSGFYFAFNAATYEGLDPEVTGCQPYAVRYWLSSPWGTDTAASYTRVSIGPLICPHGWSTATMSQPASTSTDAICCPTDYYYDASDSEVVTGGGSTSPLGGACKSSVSSGQVISFASPIPDGSIYSWSSAVTTLSEAGTVGALNIRGWNIGTTPTATAQATSTSGTAVLTGSVSSDTPGAASTGTSASATSSPSSNALSTGAKVGIGLGVALGVIGVAALIMAIWIVYRRKGADGGKHDEPKSIVPQDGPEVQAFGDPKQSNAELHGSPYGTSHEMPNEERYEMPNEQRLREMDAVRPPAELESRAAPPYK